MRGPEPIRRLFFTRGVAGRGSSKATAKRSEKLRREAENCVDIAVRETAPDFAAILIDEALKLSKRARELGGPALFAKNAEREDDA